MLICNDKILNHKAVKGDGTGHYEIDVDYKKLQAELRSAHGEILRFIRPGVFKKNSSGLMEPVPFMTVNLKSNRVTDKGESEYWLYADSVPKKKDGAYVLSRTAKFMGSDMVLSTKEDMDLIYFLVRLSEQYKRGDFIIDDPKKMARATADAKRTAAAINTALYGALSPLADDATMKEVAASWGLSNVDKKSGDEVRIEFEALLPKMDKAKKKNHRAKGSKEFLASLGNIDDEMRKRGLIRRGEDKGYIKYVGKIFKYVTGDTEEELLFIPNERTGGRFEYFCDVMLRENNLANWKNLKTLIIDEKYIDSITRMEDIRWLCKEEGINQKQKSLDSLKGELKEIYV